MQKERHAEIGILIYLCVLLFFTLINIIEDGSYLDVLYLIVVLCCVLKFLIIMKN